MNESKTPDPAARLSAEEIPQEVSRLQRREEVKATHPRPRGFVFKAKTWEELEEFERAVLGRK